MSKNPQQPNPHFRGERGAPGDPVPASEAIQPDQPEKKPSKLKEVVPWAVAGILGLIIGGAIGNATSDDQPSEIESMSGELTQTLTDYYISSDECRAAR